MVRLIVRDAAASVKPGPSGGSVAAASGDVVIPRRLGTHNSVIICRSARRTGLRIPDAGTTRRPAGAQRTRIEIEETHDGHDD
jgi:hypothetical protein